MGNVEIKDLVFIAVFATLVFFGALFLFISLKEPNVNRQVSVRALERNINHKVNKRIQKLQSRNLMQKSKMRDFGKVTEQDLSKEATNFANSKYKIDIFESHDSDLASQVPQTASERVMALINKEDHSGLDSADKLQQYKEEMIQKARAQGWVIEISDDLEVTSAKPL